MLRVAAAREVAKTLLVGAVLAVLAAATLFMMVELSKCAHVRVQPKRR